MASLCLLPGVDPGCMGGSMDKHDLAKNILWPRSFLTSSVSAPHMASLCLLPGVNPGCMGGSMDKHDLGLS